MAANEESEFSPMFTVFIFVISLAIGYIYSTIYKTLKSKKGIY